MTTANTMVRNWDARNRPVKAQKMTIAKTQISDQMRMMTPIASNIARARETLFGVADWAVKDRI